jgi:hypothetical protein
MKVWTKVTLGAAGLLLGAAAVALLGLWGIMRGACGNEILSDVPAPRTSYRAVIFQRDCGATTGFSTHVSVMRGSRRLPNEAGNAFVADDSTTSAGPDVSLFVEVRWRDSAQLDIYHDTRARVFLADSLVEGVRIRFLTRPHIPRRRRG